VPIQLSWRIPRFGSCRLTKRRNRKFSDEIEGRGGKVVRFKLDYEIKRDLYADLAQTWQDQGKYPETVKQAVARRHGLKVVNKEIQIPDMRLEYANDTPSKPLERKPPWRLVPRHYKREVGLAECSRS
jgi:hypothetical protein